MNPRGLLAVAIMVVAARAPLLPADAGAGAQNQASTARPFSISAGRYTFEPARLEVNVGDLVAVELRSRDIAHSFTIERYRISKRVGPGDAVTFEFRAEHAGAFPFFCDLKAEDGCKQMRGELIVRERP
jgi:cytochrome c oxidase subunit II